MKKALFLLLLAAQLRAQTGDVAVSTVKEVQSESWKQWTFAAVAIVTATAGVLLVSMDNGKKQTHN